MYLVVIRRAPSGESRRPIDEQFDLSSGCPRCGAGAKQVSNLLLRLSDLKPAAIRETHDGDYIITKELANQLAVIGVKRFCFRDIDLIRRGECAVSHVQLLPRTVLPRATAESTGMIVDRTGFAHQCNLCRRCAHYGIPHVDMTLVYRSDDVENLVTENFVALTYECFGASIIHPRKPPEIPFREVTRIARSKLIIDGPVAPLFRAIPGVELYKCLVV